MLKFKFQINFYLKIFFSVFLFLINIGTVFAQTNLEQAIPGAPEAVGGPAEYIYYFFQYGLMLIGAMALGALVFGGFLYIASAGNQQKTQQGKDIIIGGISGLLILLGSYLILYIINPDLTKLKEIRLQTVEINVPEKKTTNVNCPSGQPHGECQPGEKYKNYTDCTRSNGCPGRELTQFFCDSNGCWKKWTSEGCAPTYDTDCGKKQPTGKTYCAAKERFYSSEQECLINCPKYRDKQGKQGTCSDIPSA